MSLAEDFKADLAPVVPLGRGAAHPPQPQTGLPTVVVGAGEAGRALARDLLHVPQYGLTPIGFLDDDPAKEAFTDLPLLGRLDDLAAVAVKLRIQCVVLAIPGLSASKVRQLASMAAASGARVQHLPTFVAALQRDVVGTDMRTLEVGELIGRPEMHVVSPEAAAVVRGKVVLVTGAGGSIGSELCRQVLGFAPARLVMLDHDESNLHRMQLEVSGEALLDSDDIVVADIRDGRRLRQLFRDVRPDVVFHAAALKHLPMLERHPCEGVKSNVLGTQLLADAAVEFGVELFVLISTDKAADPTSVLGATKQLAEMVVKSGAPSHTVFTAVRFGNVLGSRGSLLAVLSEQLKNGDDITVTHPDVTRYFMTIEEAVGLVLEAARLAEGRETFVLDMGQPVRILDLVHKFADQLGLPAVGIRFTGLRPGEKLNESLFGANEIMVSTEHPRIFKTSSHTVGPEFRSYVQDLIEEAEANRRDEVLRLLRQLVPGYATPVLTAEPAFAAPYPDDY
jgi:FlaA1/EpsC-like NDP-sugar epimerase